MSGYSIMVDIKETELLFFRALALRYKTLDVTPVHSRIMMEIYQHDGKMCQKDIEDAVLCNKSTLSAVLNTMEKNGLIKRVGVADDYRKKYIVLSEKALEIVDVLNKDRIIIDEIINEGISDEERKSLGEILEKLKKNIERI